MCLGLSLSFFNPRLYYPLRVSNRASKNPSHPTIASIPNHHMLEDEKHGFPILPDLLLSRYLQCNYYAIQPVCGGFAGEPLQEYQNSFHKGLAIH
jgi:hypothetical protein